jgi:hypothetical protein
MCEALLGLEKNYMHDKVNKNNNLPKIQFLNDFFLHKHKKVYFKSFVSKNMKPLTLPLSLW